jgi:hypothetical protein
LECSAAEGVKAAGDGTMPQVRVVISLVVGVALLAACASRPFTLECVGPTAVMGATECGAVADYVAPRVGLERADLGTLRDVSVERVDCTAVGLTQEIPELAGPRFDGCWRVILHYEDDLIEYLVARDDDTGRIGLYD